MPQITHTTILYGVLHVEYVKGGEPMDSRKQRLAELARRMDDDDLTSLLDTHKKIVEQYRENYVRHLEIVEALLSELIERKTNGQE